MRPPCGNSDEKARHVWGLLCQQPPPPGRPHSALASGPPPPAVWFLEPVRQQFPGVAAKCPLHVTDPESELWEAVRLVEARQKGSKHAI